MKTLTAGPLPRVGWRILGLAFLTAACSQPAPVAELSGSTMGTGYSVQLSPAPQPSQMAMLQQAIDERLAAINQAMSTYIDDSDLVRFNQSTSTDWQAVSEDLVSLVKRADSISQATGGLYDVTVGPLVNLWGFGSSGTRESPPGDTAIADALQRVGYQKVLHREQPAGLRKLHPQLEIDLSSIAKGWAVDELGDLLQRNGFENFLIDIGGETLARGAKANGQPWQIAIEHPSDGPRSAQGVLVANNLAVATSGDYRNFFMFNNQRYAHTVNPLTGAAIRHRLASVTVVGADATQADAWATALLALGESKGPTLAGRHGIAALFIVRDGDALREQLTPALQRQAIWTSHF